MYETAVSSISTRVLYSVWPDHRFIFAWPIPIAENVNHVHIPGLFLNKLVITWLYVCKQQITN